MREWIEIQEEMLDTLVKSGVLPRMREWIEISIAVEA